jgi:hypothetical protein
MSRFHAGFSVGTVVGALSGAGANAIDLSVTVHLVAVAALLAIVVPLAAQRFLVAVDDLHHGEHHGPLIAWRERRTVLVGVQLTMAFTEGTGNDWLGVARSAAAAPVMPRVAGLRGVRGVDDHRPVVRAARARPPWSRRC